MELGVDLPMALYCHGKGTVDLANNWSVGGQTRHTGVGQGYLRECKDAGLLVVGWQTGEDMTPDSHAGDTPKGGFGGYRAELAP